MNAYTHLNSGTGPTARDVLKALRLPRGMRRAHGIAIFATRDALAPSYARDAFNYELRYTQEARGTDGTYTRLSDVSFEVPGYVRNGHTDARETYTPTDGAPYRKYSETFEPRKGFWSLFAADERLIDALECVAPAALVSLEVRLDWGTTTNHVEALLHADALFLVAYEPRKGDSSRKREFLIDVSCDHHNTARFGVPSYFDD